MLRRKPSRRPPVPRRSRHHRTHRRPHRRCRPRRNPRRRTDPDPASSHFLADAGLLLVAVKPSSVADYEQVIRALQEAMAKQTDPIKLAAAKGWRVYKAAETDAKGNPLYVHMMLPAVTGLRLPAVAAAR